MRHGHEHCSIGLRVAMMKFDFVSVLNNIRQPRRVRER